MTVEVHHLTVRIGTKAVRARFESPKRHFCEERFDRFEGHGAEVNAERSSLVQEVQRMSVLTAPVSSVARILCDRKVEMTTRWSQRIVIA
jgi:hypothetical protein